MFFIIVVDLLFVIYKDYIFFLGGRIGVGVYNLVVMYYFEKGYWIIRVGIFIFRFNFGVCVFDEEIYVAGG